MRVNNCNQPFLWLKEQRADAGLQCNPIRWDQAQEWHFQDGSLVHSSGCFFSIAGISVSSNQPELDGLQQPIIVQPEIGILGFLLRRTKQGPQLLVQAKTEPGNIGATQLAPTVQATVSNFTRVHGGDPTEYLEYFPRYGNDRGVVVADIRQSEEGTRFFNKYNRNVTVLVEGSGPDPVSTQWQWCDACSILELLTSDFCVNTDARSSLVCSDWSLLTPGRKPFERWQQTGGFGEQLLASYLADDNNSLMTQDEIRDSLEAMRESVSLTVKDLPIEKLAGWKVDEGRIFNGKKNEFEVPMFRVQARHREVKEWDQPLVASLREGSAVLVCQNHHGLLHFLLNGSIEPGFTNKIQFGPSIQTRSGKSTAEMLGLTDADVFEHVSCRQSDEGGRFYQSVTEHKVVEVAENCRLDKNDLNCWATLGQIQRLVQTSGYFTNEFRSTFALLLRYL